AAAGEEHHGNGDQGGWPGAEPRARLARGTEPPERPRGDRDGPPRGAAGRAREETLRAPCRPTGLPQLRERADAHGTDRPGRTHVASGYSLQWCRRRERMDVENRPALSAANPGS